LDRTKFGSAAGTLKGAYVLSDCDGDAQAVILGTGSEIPICLKAQEMLAAKGVKARVVSVPCMELFDEQDEAYRASVLPSGVKARVACEAGIRLGWDKYIGIEGKFVGMSTFGASAPANQLYEHFKITPENIVNQVETLLK
jgi:transketolase